MIKPTRRIPEIAIASLVLGGCGNGPSVNSVSNRLCRAFQDCDPNEFALYYGSIAECVESYADYLNDDFRGVSSACRSAALRYYDCVAGEYARLCSDAYYSTRCDDLLDRARDACN